MRNHQISSQTFKIITQYGDMLVVKQGANLHQHHHHHHHHHHPRHSNQSNHQQHASSQHHNSHHHSSGGGGGGDQTQAPSRPVLMTFHDLGMNSELQFATFCERDEVKLMLQTFTMVHVNFIGQEFAAGSTACGQPVASLPDDYKYPSVEQMAECIVDVCAQLRVRSFIALAVGAGAHIVSTLALMRPDLVHGLFLINPILSSCSITEWLYFKMSAIASNHQILGGGGGGGSSAASTISGGNSTEDHHSQASDEHHLHHHHHHHHNQQQHSSHATSGFKKLWRAVNHHHHHQHHQHQQHHQNQTQQHDQQAAGSRCESQESCAASESEERTSTASEPQSPSTDPQTQPQSQSPSPSPSQAASQANLQQAGQASGGKQAAAASSRLRQLILSRNFKLGKQQQQQQQQHTGSGGGAAHHSQRDSASLASLPAATAAAAASEEGANEESRPRRASAGSQASSNASLASSCGSGKRPPLEYLMYHHFGTASLQRFRRMSSDLQASPAGLLGRRARTAEVPQRQPSEEENNDDADDGAADQASGHEPAGQRHRASCDSTASGQSGGAGERRAVASAIRGHRDSQSSTRSGGCGGGGGDNDSQRSRDSLTRAATSASARYPHQQAHPGQQRMLQRSHSVCLEASYLASISSDRQRTAYMQSVYKRYFTQLNAHNLWLFAQSFVKRRTLNLRKDCGAAAHAAAAAAALGTSICAAFVGAGGPQGGIPPVTAVTGPSAGSKLATSQKQSRETTKSAGQEAHARSSERPHDKGAAAAAGAHTASTTASKDQHHHRPHHQQHSQQQQQPRALVAGTKVKRTFTCQTLIMCSSVHIHRERALKLMSLLNPLQATWIKTDQLLVLEEKPEKVCQALRLFLQGIGYSMSTYERRLRLSSGQASISSADSNGSARSLNLDSSSSSAVAAAAAAAQGRKSSVGGTTGTSSPLRQKMST